MTVVSDQYFVSVLVLFVKANLIMPACERSEPLCLGHGFLLNEYENQIHELRGRK